MFIAELIRISDTPDFMRVRKSLEDLGYTTILVDDGDSVQGEAMGTLSKGEISIALMNEMGYDVAIPGNHEYDYGMEQFLRMSKQLNSLHKL